MALILAFAMELPGQNLPTGAAFFAMAGIIDQHAASGGNPLMRRF